MQHSWKCEFPPLIESLAMILKGKNPNKTKPTKMPLHMESHSKVQQSTLSITHHALWLSGPLLLFLGIFLSSSFHPGRLQTGIKSKS